MVYFYFIFPPCLIVVICRLSVMITTFYISTLTFTHIRPTVLDSLRSCYQSASKENLVKTPIQIRRSFGHHFREEGGSTTLFLAMGKRQHWPCVFRNRKKSLVFLMYYTNQSISEIPAGEAYSGRPHCPTCPTLSYFSALIKDVLLLSLK